LKVVVITSTNEVLYVDQELQT